MQTIIVIGTSAGGMDALKSVLAALPPDLPAAVCLVMHIGANKSVLPEILSRAGPLPVRHARDGEPLRPGVVLVAPPDRHLLLSNSGDLPHTVLSHGPKENYTRPAIDPLFRSAAAAFGARVVGVILTGYLDDGTVGLQAIKACGGTAIVQEPSDAFAPDMPASARDHVAVDLLLPLCRIGAELATLAQRRAALARPPAHTPVPDWVRLENRFITPGAGMDELEKIAEPSTYTCPECQGTLWQIKAPPPQRFRCHTGHSFTAQTLEQQQGQQAEAAMWAAVRALRERERLSNGLAELAERNQWPEAAKQHRLYASNANAHAEVLTALLKEPEPEAESEPDPITT